MEEGLVRAAGGVVARSTADGQGTEVLVVHRARYDDWTFPKGKLDPGETWEEAAAREVHEETGVVVALGRELTSVDYIDNRGRPKRARYWAMTLIEDTGFTADDEITAREWLPVDDVRDRLSYPRDVAVLESFLAPPT